MRIRGSLLVVAVLLGGSACSHEVAGMPAAGEVPPSTVVRSSVPDEPEVVAECTRCDRDVVEAAIENPVVGQAKEVEKPPACEEILPLATIGTVVAAPAHPGSVGTSDGCVADFETADRSRFGRVLVGFSSPVSIEPVAISEHEGNTLIESAISAETCEYGLALNADIDHFDHGSWLTVRVVSAEGNPPACGLARRLVEVGFENLSDVG